MIMGGFHLFKHGSVETGTDEQFISQEDDIPIHPLAASDLYRDGTIQPHRNTIRSDVDFSSFTVPTEAEIKDKGKSDWLAKSLVLLQTSWFVMQCIARAIEHLPVTHLEIVTLAYAALNFVIYVFWWNKPLNIDRPVRVFRKSEVEEPISEARRLSSKANRNGLEAILNFIVGNQDNDVDLTHEDGVPMFWADSVGKDVIIADLIMVGVGICFGTIHCIAWGFSFPTHKELLIWRVSSVAITAVPVYISSMGFLGFWLVNMNFEVTDDIVAFTFFVAGILYIIARVFTLALALTSLRDLPPGAFETVHWTTFVPHV